ncbi:hypothetical protein P4132_21035 [Pseudomonas aeruginosa]|nr:hypothetical protein [Pseudomonas aeruginosa]
MRNPPNQRALTVSAGAAGKPRRPSNLDDSAGGGSRLGLSLRETPGSVSVANRASFERRACAAPRTSPTACPA